MTSIDRNYLPFSAEVVRKYFGWRDLPKEGPKRQIQAAEAARKRAHKYVAKFEESAARRRAVEGQNRVGKPLKSLSKAYQLEKDETFWTAATWIAVFESGRTRELLLELLPKAFKGRDPMPLDGELTTWEHCLEGQLSLRLEAVHPAPRGYKDWLAAQYRCGGAHCHPIPHVVDSAMPRPGKKTWKNLEGSTHMDALIVNEDNGFVVAIEAKVLSDISAHVTYDVRRNQMARSLDVLMDDAVTATRKYANLEAPLRARRKDRTLLLLQTPRRFRNPGRSRLYWYKFHEYTANDKAIHDDLHHRTPEECATWPKRIGWLTWEDCSEADAELCGWLGRNGT